MPCGGCGPRQVREGGRARPEVPPAATTRKSRPGPYRGGSNFFPRKSLRLRARPEKGDKSNLCEAPSGPLRGKLDLSPFSGRSVQDRQRRHRRTRLARGNQVADQVVADLSEVWGGGLVLEA